MSLALSFVTTAGVVGLAAAVDVSSVVASVTTTSVLDAVTVALVSTSSALIALAKIVVETTRVDRVVATIIFFFNTKKSETPKTFLLKS